MIDFLRITASFASIAIGIVGFVWMIRQFDNPFFKHQIWCVIVPLVSVSFLFGMIFLGAWLGAPYGAAESTTSIAKHSTGKDPILGVELFVILLFIGMAKVKSFGKKK